jgi:hypothetical protein
MRVQLRVIKDIGAYKVDQRVAFDSFYARQLIAAGIAVEDVEEPPPAEDKPRRRYRRRDLTAEGE